MVKLCQHGWLASTRLDCWSCICLYPLWQGHVDLRHEPIAHTPLDHYSRNFPNCNDPMSTWSTLAVVFEQQRFIPMIQMISTLTFHDLQTPGWCWPHKATLHSSDIKFHYSKPSKHSARFQSIWGCVHAYFAKAESAFWNADSKRRSKTPFTGVLFMLPSRRRRFREHALRIVRGYCSSSSKPERRLYDVI